MNTKFHFINTDVDIYFSPTQKKRTLSVDNIFTVFINNITKKLNNEEDKQSYHRYIDSIINAIHNNDINYIKSNINTTTSSKETIIHTFIFMNKYEYVEKLLKLNIHPDPKDIDGQTPLFRTIFTDNPDFIDLLIKYGCDINIQDNDGNTVLHLAVLIRNIPIIKKLISYGVIRDIKNKLNMIPIDLCKIKSGSYITHDQDIVKLFTLSN